MDFCIKNSNADSMKVYIEPSADEIELGKDDVLMVSIKGEDLPSVEFHAKGNVISVWMPSGCSASFSINGNHIETMYQQFDW